MSRIIKSELYKYKIQGYYIISIIFAVCLNAFMCLAKSVGGEVSGTTIAPVYEIVGSSCLFLIACIIVGITCRDFKDGTMKNVVSSGNTRNEIFIGRLISTYIAVTIIYIINAVLSVVSFIAFYNPTSIDFVKILSTIGTQYITILVMTLLFYGLASIIKVSVLSIILNLAIIFAIDGAFAVIALITKNEFFANISTNALGTFNNMTAFGISFVVFAGLGVLFTAVAYIMFKKKAI